MRLRIILLVLAISSLILVSFLIPLALLLRTFAANRATSAATAQAQWLAPLVATLTPGDLRVTLGRVNAQDPQEPTSVFLPGGQVLGASAVRSQAVRLALGGSSFTRRVAGGENVLVAVAGLGNGTAVIETFVPDSKLDQGVSQAWLVLGVIGVGLLALSVVISAQLSRSLLMPLAAVARASELLADGDLSARAPYDGPPEVQQVSSGLNRLAARIGELLTRERETLADLSHQLRTPLTALRIDAESLRDQAEMVQLTTDVEALTRTVNEIIREARRPSASGGRIACDAAQIVQERAEFWQALAEDQGRYMTISIGTDWLPVRVPAQDLAACVDILLENVFAHTPEGVSFGVRLAVRAGGGAWLTVADDGPGFAEDTNGYPVVRGTSGRGSTGLGLDIARRIAEASGGSLTIGRSPRGGAAITLALGPTAAPAERERHQKGTNGHGRRRKEPGRSRPIDARLSAELSEWSAIVGHDVNAG
jgi:signal transduction histidine kinase